MINKIRVAIVDDHLSIVDGYKFRLGGESDIEVVCALSYGEEIEQIIAQYQPINVLILDVNVPTSETNRSPYPILHIIPKLLQQHPDLHILIISMYKQGVLIKALVEAGASGFILKDDRDTLEALGSVVRTVAGGGVYFSKEAHQVLLRKASGRPQLSERQIGVLSLCAAYPDKTSTEIGAMLGLADTTVRNLLSTIYLKLGVRSRTAAVARGEQLGLITPVDTYPPNEATPQ